MHFAAHIVRSRDSLLVSARLLSENCKFESGQGWWANFLLQSELCVLTLTRCQFHPHVTAVAHKRPDHSAKSADGKLHLNTHTPLTEWADYAAVQAECGNLSGKELTHNSSGNTWLQTSQLAGPLWTDPGLKSGISLCEHPGLKSGI